MSNKIAIVLIRGLIGIRHDIKETLSYLNLEKKHACVVREDSPTLQGMLAKVQGYVTYGPVTESTIKSLEKRKAKNGKVYHLAPPVGGFERKGIKKAYTVGGALGDRDTKMNDLLAKMV